jgi:hypothetical protein
MTGEWLFSIRANVAITLRGMISNKHRTVISRTVLHGDQNRWAHAHRSPDTGNLGVGMENMLDGRQVSGSLEGLLSLFILPNSTAH